MGVFSFNLLVHNDSRIGNDFERLVVESRNPVPLLLSANLV